ncbi:MAG: lamin tail domain-containing protein [Microbacter sp.]
MKKIILILLLFVPSCLQAQYVDSFSDGDFTNHPTWNGSTDKFIVNSAFQLQLNALPVSSSAYLSTVSKAIEQATWSFHLKTGLLLTSANYVNFYLVSDSANLSGPLNGYYLMIGNTNKEIALYRQQGTQKIKLAAGGSNRLPTTGSVTDVIVNITRDTLGNWSVFSKLPSDSAQKTEFFVRDTVVKASSYSGIFCNYSSSNSTKYFFDDFKITGNPYVDRIPPRIVSYQLLNRNQLMILFSKNIVMDSAHFVFMPEVTNFQTQHIKNQLIFSFSSPISIRSVYTLQLTNIYDEWGNKMNTSSIDFGLWNTTFGDVVFNELMVRPSPVVGLPDAQYIELYNRCDFPIQLKNWTLSYGSKNYLLNEGILKSHDMVILCHESKRALLTPYGNVVTVSGFPVMAQSGQRLIMRNEQDSLIAFVTYSDAWYQNDFKSSGGWSLECIDPTNLSGNFANWKASESPTGGTPGHANSIAGICEDMQLPDVISFSFSFPDTLTLTFNKSMLLSELTKSSNYQLTDYPAVSVYQSDFPEGKWVKIKLEGISNADRMLHLIVHGVDVNGHALAKPIVFGIPDSCSRFDVVINEILSHPKADGNSFVELYNRSEKVIDLKSLWLNRMKSNGSIDVGFPIVAFGYQLFPHHYVVLTKDRVKVTSFYDCPDSIQVVEMPSFPSLPNVSGNIMLISRDGAVIDSAAYNELWHDPIITNPTGVSFERINPDELYFSSSNWHSASSMVGYATPGYQNSQFNASQSSYAGSSCFWLDKTFFTPDNDGSDDLLWMRYAMPESGFSATITIFDVSGRQVRRLSNNALLGTQGTVSWNGLTDHGAKAPIGVYVIYVEAVNLSTGKQVQAKLACTLSAK